MGWPNAAPLTHVTIVMLLLSASTHLVTPAWVLNNASAMHHTSVMVSNAALVKSVRRNAHPAQSAGMANVTARTDTLGSSGDQRDAWTKKSAKRRRTTTVTRMQLARRR